MNQAQRVLDILQQLTKGQVVCVKSLAKNLDEGERTIQRDFRILKDFLQDNLLVQQKGCYRLLDRNLFASLFQTKSQTDELLSFLELFVLIDSHSMKLFEDDKLFSFMGKIKKQSEEIYQIFEHPIEALEKNKFLKDMKLAIKDRRYVDLIYHEKEAKNLKNVKPLKILYAKNNWYLVALTQNYKHNHGFKRFRINFIEEFTLKAKTFQREIEATQYIKSMQSLFQDYKAKSFDVKLKVDKEIARYFKVKKYLSSQKLIEERDNNLINAIKLRELGSGALAPQKAEAKATVPI